MTSPSPRRTLKTSAAANYLGLSASLLRKMRARGPEDPLGPGPDFIRLSPCLIVYELTALDSWLEQRRATPFAARGAATSEAA